MQNKINTINVNTFNLLLNLYIRVSLLSTLQLNQINLIFYVNNHFTYNYFSVLKKIAPTFNIMNFSIITIVDDQVLERLNIDSSLIDRVHDIYISYAT